MSKDARDIIIRPIISERSLNETGRKKYTFEVARDANKIEIASAIKEIFDVDVDKVNTINMKGKKKRQGRITGRTKHWKKAVITLTEDSPEIEGFGA